MPAILRIVLLFFTTTSLLPGAESAGPDAAPPANGREREAARDLLQQAQRLLDAQYRASPLAGFRYTASVAAAFAQIGDHNAAEATFSHLQLVNRFGDLHLRTLAVGYARAGDLARVRQTIARIQDAEPGYARQRPLTWQQAGQALAKAGHKGLAAQAFAEAVGTIPGPDKHCWFEAQTLAEVAECQHELGLADEALATLELAVSLALAEPKISMRTHALSVVAATHARLGFLSRALATVEQISELEERCWAWFKIVDTEAKLGRWDEAYRVAERIEGRAVAKTWMTLTVAQARIGRLPEARQALGRAEAAVNRITAAMDRNDMMLMLADSRAAVGDRSGAAACLEELGALVEGTVAVEDGPFAIRRQIERVPGAVYRHSMLRAVAASQAKLGLADAARRTFERAKVAARGEEPGLWQNSALIVVAGSQADAGMPDEAMRTLAELPESARRWLDYVPVARARVRAGDLDGATRVVDLYPGNANPTWYYIVEALLDAGDPKNALRIGLKAATPMEEFLHDAARRLAAAGDVATVTDAVAHAYVEDRVALLLGAAEGLLDRAGGPAMAAAAAANTSANDAR